MRPLGGWLFGWLADSHGRKTSMLISVLMMCTGSLMIALLPTYASIGVWAPGLLLVARLLVESGAEVPYVGTACPRTKHAEADRDWLERLITRRVPLHDWTEVFDRKPDDIKVAVDLRG